MANREFYEISSFYPQFENYYGLLTGLAYTLPYMITGLLMGAVTSRVNRARICGLSIMIGGLSQFLTGIIPNFNLLCGMRVVHGAANSATNPLIYSLIADYVPPERRATANSFISTAVYAGISLSSLSILLIKSLGWQSTYKVIGAFGLLVGTLFLTTVREPKNRKNGRILTEEQLQELERARQAEETEEEKAPATAKELLQDMKGTIVKLW